MKTRWLPLSLLLLLLLSACGGTLSISLDATPTSEVGLASTMQVLETQIATLQPQPGSPQARYALDLSSDSETIRQAMLRSHLTWQTAWVDAEVTDVLPGAGTQKMRTQLWVDRLAARFRALSGPSGSSPEALQVADGTTQERVDLVRVSVQAQPMSAEARADWQPPQEVTDSIEPHPLDLEIDARLAEAVFPSALAQRRGSYTPTGLENVAGRSAIVVDWFLDGAVRDRFWIDTQTGLILRWDSFAKDASRQAELVSSLVVTGIAYDLPMPEALFSLSVGERPQFALNASGEAAPTPEPPAAVFEPGAGELYFVVDRSPDALQLYRLPGSCITQTEACPRPEPVEGFVNQHSTIRPLVWSPDGSQAALVQENTLFVYGPETAEWKAVVQFPILPFDPVWSPDGEWLIFTVQNQGDHQDLYAVHPDGSALQDLTNGLFHDDLTTLFVDGWTADGRLIFTAISGLEGKSYFLRLGEANPVLVSDRSYNHGVVAVSPDGTHMAYSASENSAVAIYHAQLNDLVTGASEPKRIASFQSAAVQQMLWTPDGESLVFLIASGGSPETFVNTVYTMRSDGSEMRQIFQQPNLQRLTFASDGGHILAEGASNGRIYIIPLEGGEPRLLDAPGLRLDQPMLGVSWR